MSDQKAALKARMDKLQKRLKAIEAKEKKEADYRAMLAGRIALEIAETDAGFSSSLRAGLEAGLSSKRDRALFDLPEHGAAGKEEADAAA